jgi:hypothetical protein
LAVEKSLTAKDAKVLEGKTLPVRNHPLYFADVARAYQGAFPQLAFPFFIFGGQDVAQVRMSSLHFSRPGFFEALGCAFVRFQFRHKSSVAISRQLSAFALNLYLHVSIKLLWNRGREL